ncbi:hypothetical protein AVEN_42631-1 [Araneus ventricosus]|uniref:Uncharacterized protein n=1 Tax=Araneus ventricosus TaxID=182803 RepID=A0A4Y2BLT6_ARAVE|nr:hypothetical protein AVEN_42631-1 [Araneus ventricosus]
MELVCLESAVSLVLVSGDGAGVSEFWGGSAVVLVSGRWSWCGPEFGACSWLYLVDGAGVAPSSGVCSGVSIWSMELVWLRVRGYALVLTSGTHHIFTFNTFKIIIK